MHNQKTPEDYHAGIDVGSVSLNALVINSNKEIVFEFPYKRHFGKVEEEVYALVRALFKRFGKTGIRSVSFTGTHGKILSEKFGIFYEFETVSQVLGTLFISPEVKSIISMGGQDSSLYQISHRDNGWELENFNTNGPCASGTGSFIDQQAERLATAFYDSKKNISQDQIDSVLADFIQLGQRSKKPANVACRCTVFTKSDMIHLQNKGEKLQDIIYGLHIGNARNYMSAIVSNRALKEPIVFIGGLSLNSLQVKAFKNYFSNLIVPPFNTSIGALGVALKALELNRADNLSLETFKGLEPNRMLSVPTAPKLALKKTFFPETKEISLTSLPLKVKVFLGIDIGSTTTKYVLMREDRTIMDKSYVTTQGRPIEVTQNLLKRIRNQFGHRIEILGAATTGSGRNVVGDFLNVDLIIDEITAHARGAVEIDPGVDTIFEIGGQDSKYISIVNTYPLDFDMNKVCAAGTGSFLHELASKYDINIVEEFQDIALSSESPVKLAERCTVFMESDLVAYYQKGVAQKDLIAGLCYAIVYNYLNRVVGKRKIGNRVMFLGGPSLNKGVVAAFENVLGQAVIVPCHREVLGAYGAAIGVHEKMQAEKKIGSKFRGVKRAVNDKLHFSEKVCRSDPNCHNQCKLKIYNFDDRRSIWGGECGRYELNRGDGSRKENFFRLRQTLWEKHLNGVYRELQGQPLMEVEGRPTVGIQRALYGHQTGILWAHFFNHLGFQPVFTPPTNSHISKVGIETAVDGVCYPVKVSHGHIKELMGKTKYLFIPSMITMPTPSPTERGCFCPLVMSNSYMVRMALNLDQTTILNPVVHLKYAPETLAMEISKQIKSKLGVRKTSIKEAL
ncbi:MAG: CoA activase, partial [Deltaproteobacteria bacterium]